IIQEFQEKHPDLIKICGNSSNLGITRNFERGIREASGDVIALADQDDIWAPNKLARQANQLSKSSGSLVFHNVETVDESLHHIGDHWENIGYEPGITAESRKALFRLICGNYIKGSTIMFESTLRDKIIPFPDDIGYDWYIAIMALILSEIVEIDEKLQKWRLHDAQASHPAPETFLRKIQQGIVSKGNTDYYRKQTAKWASLEQRITDVEEDQFTLEREFVIKLIQDRYRYERNRAIIYDEEAGLFQSLPALFSNLQGKRYARYGNAPTYLYALKDGYHAYSHLF
ncbi:MAG: glycosyltransferase, partial [Candidatus Paceibacteria bacterium]